MTTQEVANRLVELCRQGQNDQAHSGIVRTGCRQP